MTFGDAGTRTRTRTRIHLLGSGGAEHALQSITYRKSRQGECAHVAAACHREESMGDRLKDKVALVSGAGSSGPGGGNGNATAVLFAREGAKVFAADLNRATASRPNSLAS